MRPNPLRPLIAALRPTRRDPVGRRPRKSTLHLDALEGRVVLSHMSLRGRNLPPRFAAMSQLRAARQNPAPAAATPTTATPAVASTTGSAAVATTASGSQGVDPRGPNGQGAAVMQDTRLRTHLDQLRQDTNGVVAGSTITDAQRQALGTALGALRDAGATLDRAKLATVGDGLLAALADGSYDASAATLKADFAAAITGTNLDSALVDGAYEAVTSVARGLNVSGDELSTLATDRAAIQADLTRLGVDPTQGPGGHGPAGDSNADLIFAPGGPGQGPGDRGHDRGGPGRGPGGLARGAGRAASGDPASGSTHPDPGDLDPGRFGRDDGGMRRGGQPGGPMGRGGPGFGGGRL